MKTITKAFHKIIELPNFMSLSRNQLYKFIESDLDVYIPESHHDCLVAVIRDYRLLTIDKDEAVKLLEAR